MDSTLPFLELPEEACNRWKDAFNLDYDAKRGLFYPSPITITQLRRRAPEVVLSIAAPSNHSHSLSIILPFASFDHTLQNDSKSDPIAYIPIKMANKERGVVLGRVLFQEM